MELTEEQKVEQGKEDLVKAKAEAKAKKSEGAAGEPEGAASDPMSTRLAAAKEQKQEEIKANVAEVGAAEAEAAAQNSKEPGSGGVMDRKKAERQSKQNTGDGKGLTMKERIAQQKEKAAGADQSDARSEAGSVSSDDDDAANPPPSGARPRSPLRAECFHSFGNPSQPLKVRKVRLRVQ